MLENIHWQGVLDTILVAQNRGEKSTEDMELLCLVKPVKTL